MDRKLARKGLRLIGYGLLAQGLCLAPAMAEDGQEKAAKIFAYATELGYVMRAGDCAKREERDGLFWLHLEILSRIAKEGWTHGEEEAARAAGGGIYYYMQQRRPAAEVCAEARAEAAGIAFRALGRLPR